MNNKIKNSVYEKIAGCLYGYGIGSAMGMPSMLLPQCRVWTYFGWINELLPGHLNNPASSMLPAGKMTLSAQQAIPVLNAVIAAHGVVMADIIQQELMRWSNALPNDAYLKTLIAKNTAGIILPEYSEDQAICHLSVVRTAPLGCALLCHQENLFIERIVQSCRATHTSDIAIAGAAVVTWAISRAIDDVSWENITMELPILAEKVQTMYESTLSPSLKRRIQFAMEFSNRLKGCTDRNILRELYECLGAGRSVIETVPTALALVNIAEGDPLRAMTLAANLGGNTDAIASIAGAICGALSGVTRFPQEMIIAVNDANHLNFNDYAKALLCYREQ